MRPESWKRAKEIFHAALELPEAERQPYLERACVGEPEIRGEVEKLLVGHDPDSDFLSPEALGLGEIPVPGAPPAPEPEGLSAGAPIGPYRVVRKLGEGGMGAVYLARREELDRLVAIKLVRPGFASPTSLRRLSLEARALGRLQHPGIAQIFEAGSVEREGVSQPFFAMEYVEGKPLSEYASRHEIGLRERLSLLAQICEAVHHAHQKGVIHRDLKPANILVDSSGQPKILDFGVARLVEDNAPAGTLATVEGQILGTLPYMSPEQVAGDPDEIDTRADVYSLGVIGYELLGGALPLDLKRKALSEAARIVAEQEPKSLGTLDRTLRGDLETIVGKALAKERERRYPSAAELAADIERYLRDEPITARPASAIYQLRKFSKRHKALVWGTAALFLCLGGGLFLVDRERVRAVQAEALAETRLREAEAARERAGRESEKSEAVRGFLEGMLFAADPKAGQRDLTVREMLDRAAEKIEIFRGEPETAAALRRVIGQSYLGLGKYPEAKTQLEAYLAWARESRGEASAEAAEAWNDLGVLLARQGELEDAESAIGDALEIYGKLGLEGGATAAKWRTSLAQLYELRGKRDEAQALFEQAREALRNLDTEDPAKLAAVQEGLGNLFREKGQLEMAEEALREAVSLGRRAPDADPLEIARFLHHLGTVLRERNKLDEAEEIFRETVALQRKHLGDEHPNLAIGLSSFSAVLVARGRHEEAEATLRKALAMQRKFVGPENPEIVATMSNLGTVLTERGKYDEAEPIHREALELRRKIFGEKHPAVANSLNNLARALMEQGKSEEAEESFREALEICRRSFGEKHPGTVAVGLNLGTLLGKQGKLEEAEPLLRKSLESARAALGQGHPTVAAVLHNLGEIRLQQGNYQDSETLLRQASEIRRKGLGESHPDYGRSLKALLKLYESWEKKEEVERLRAEIEKLEAERPPR